MSGLTNGVSPSPSTNVGELGRLFIHPSKWRDKTSWRKYDASVFVGWSSFKITDR